MRFFTDTKPFTHTGTFYSIPVYLNLDDEIPVVMGTNIVYDIMLRIMSFVHGNILELFLQFWSVLLDIDREIGFPFCITGEIDNENDIAED